MEVNPDARLEPDAIIVDQTHASHRHVKKFAATSAIRSKAGSGGVSRIWYWRSAFKRSASFSVSMASTPEKLAALSPGRGRRVVMSVSARLSVFFLSGASSNL